jgi:hypothetical protein
MRKLFERDLAVPAEVVERACLRRGEKVLAATRSRDGSWLLGTRQALVVVRTPGEVTALPWEQVQSADWSRDEDRLRVHEVGEFGRTRPVHEFILDDPGKLLTMLRERVTASVVLQRRVTVRGKQGLFVLGRRAPDGSGGITWAYELDAGLDPDDPEVRRLAELGLRAAAEELGLG